MMQQGNGTTLNTDEGVGQDPSIMLAYSNDSGKTWSQERLVKTGRQGQYAYRSLLPVLGSSRNRVWRISGTDPVETILVGLLIDGDVLAR
jgi:Neuraminidase (sialidase)